ncbi:MAG: efflux RND transporter permease subunit [Bacteroidales bacterium]
MPIYKSAINRPVTTVLLFIAIIVIGLYSLTTLPIDQFPEMDPPYITVMTTYPGASASEVETNVSKVIENSLNSIDGLDEITSSSKDNISVVSLKLDWGADLTEAVNDIRSYIDMLKNNLPEDCNNPFIFKFSTSSMPILMYTITANGSYPGLEKLLNDNVIPQLNRVNGIGSLSIIGAPDRIVYVDIDQAKLNSFGLPLESVGSAISNNNLNLSSGLVKMKNEQYQLEVKSEYIGSNQIKDIVVANVKGKFIYVKDLATVKDTIKDLTLDEKTNGEDAVRLMVTKQSGSNTAQICKDVKKEMDKIQLSLPEDVKVSILFDTSDDIEGAINSLEESILYALLFVVLVVFLFLGKWRATLIIGLTIPIALIVAFIYLALSGSSLNIISLSSLTIAIGMVVDDAIVVLENITKHIERGSSPREAAIYATNEVWVSVIATTLVIVVVFVPLTFLSGMAGIMFKELGWIVTIVVCTSTLVAISLTPMLASKLLKAKEMKVDEKGKLIEVKKRSGWYSRYVVKSFDKIDTAYARLIKYCLSHKTVTLIIAVLAFIASLLPFITGQVGTDFMQTQDSGRITCTVELANGTKIEKTASVARKIEKDFFSEVPEITKISSSAGSSDDASVSSLFTSTTNCKISMTVILSNKQDRERGIKDITESLRRILAKYPEIVDYKCSTASRIGPGGESTVDVEIYGYDFDETNILAQKVKSKLIAEVPNARNLDISRDKDRTNLKVTIDKEKAALHGLSSSSISMYIKNRVSGMTAGLLKEDGDEYTIKVRLKEKNRNSITAIEDLNIPTPDGKLIPLSELAIVEEYWEPPTIDRKNRQRYVKVSAAPYKTSLGELATQIQEAIKDINLPTGTSITIAGDYKDQQETFGDIGSLLLLIILLVYIVMASQFESLKKPFIIMMSVPFAISGTVLALWITGTTLDMIGALGIVMLVGIVVKNGIVLVDYTNLLRDRGIPLHEAIIKGGKSRLRPVLMTAVTTILGMLPMALSHGNSSELWRPMGIVVIGGLFISTLVTMIIIPTLYATISRSGERNDKKKNCSNFIFMNIKKTNNEICNDNI